VNKDRHFLPPTVVSVRELRSTGILRAGWFNRDDGQWVWRPFDTATLFKRVDANGDGKIRRAEYDAFLKLLPRFEIRMRPNLSLCHSKQTAMVQSRLNFKSSVPPLQQSIERAKKRAVLALHLQCCRRIMSM